MLRLELYFQLRLLKKVIQMSVLLLCISLPEWFLFDFFFALFDIPSIRIYPYTAVYEW